MSGFDLSQAEEALNREEQGQVIHVRDESGEPMYFGDDEPVTITVAGTYSKRYRKALDARISKASRSRRREPEDVQRDALDVVAQCVLDWAGFHENGTALDCTRANVTRVLGLAVWIREQVEVAMDDHAAFGKASPTS